mgnify:CR=1 FL=1
MLPTNIGYEISVTKSGQVQKMTSSDFVDLPETKQQHHQQKLNPITPENGDSSSSDDDEDAQLASSASLSSAAPPPPPLLQKVGSSAPVLSTSKVRGQLHSILSDMSPSMREKARPLLIHILSTMPQVDFDDKSQLFFHDKLIPKSNISKILVNMLSRHLTPLIPGEKEIISVLAQPPMSNFVKKIHPNKLKPFIRNSKRNQTSLSNNPYYFPRATKKELLKKL